MTFSSADGFYRLTAGGTFGRAFAIFAKRWDLFLIISGIIYIPLILMAISLANIIGSSYSTLMAGLDASGGLQVDENGTIVYNDVGGGSGGAAVDGDPFADSDPLAAFAAFGLQFLLEYLAFLVLLVAARGAFAYAVGQIYLDNDPSWLQCLKVS